jgi:hypothetical protein
MAHRSKPADRRAGERKDGRKKNAPTKKSSLTNASRKATADIKSLARVYAPAAIRELARLSVDAQSETARVSAIDKILDRAYGPVRTAAGTGAKEKPLEMIVGVSASLNAKLDRIANAIAAGAAQD